MTDEVKTEVVPEVKQEEGKQEETKQSDPFETKALEMGWRPKEEFDGAEEDFIDAKEFVRRKPLFDRLEQQGRQLKDVNKTLEQLKGHYSKVRETEFNRALAELKAARKQAITDSDGDRFDLIDDRIKEVEKEAKQVIEDSKALTNAPDPAEFTQWMGKNTWYQKDEAMTAFADRIGLRLKNSVDQGELTAFQVLQKVERAVRAEFPHKFRNPNKDVAPDVGQSKQQPSKKSDSFLMDETERKVMDNFVRQGIMTKEQYISDLRKLKGI